MTIKTRLSEDTELIEAVRLIVKKSCMSPDSHYDWEIYDRHFVPMVGYARELTERLEADTEIVTLAAWLHDIGSVRKGRQHHEVTGAEIAGEILRCIGYPEDRIVRVQSCIRTHRGSRGLVPESIEAKIVAEADALSAFDNIGGMFKAALVNEGLSQREAEISILNKLENKSRQFYFADTQDLIQSKLEAAKVLLGRKNIKSNE